LATDQLATPVFTKSNIAANATQLTISADDNGVALLNGRNYFPILYTKTLQYQVTTTSRGRTIKAPILSSHYAYDIDVLDTTDSNSVLRTMKRFSTATTEGAYNPASSGGNDVSSTVFHADAGKAPFNTPIVTANISAQTLTIDSNGRDLLYGSMLQVAKATGAGTVTTTGLINDGSAADSNIFYLDLSFGDAGTGTAAATGTTGVGGSTRELYVNGGVTYPKRYVTTVGKGYLGDNWGSETNYIFASNEAGTTAGKISATASAGFDTSI